MSNNKIINKHEYFQLSYEVSKLAKDNELLDPTNVIEAKKIKENNVRLDEIIQRLEESVNEQKRKQLVTQVD